MNLIRQIAWSYQLTEREATLFLAIQPHIKSALQRHAAAHGRSFS